MELVGDALAFARNPMSMAVLANDLQLYSGGRFLLGIGSQIKPHIHQRSRCRGPRRPAGFVSNCCASGRSGRAGPPAIVALLGEH